MARPYCIQLNLKGVRCLVVGAGEVAVRKVEGLLEAGAVVRVVAPSIDARLENRERVEIYREPYGREHLAGVSLAIAATDDRAVNARVGDDARRIGMWCNVADEPDRGNFTLPAVITRGSINLAIGTDGSAPGLAARLKRMLEAVVGPEYAVLAQELAELRPQLKKRIPDAVRRRELLLSLCDDEAVQWVREGGREGFRELVRRRMEQLQAGE